MILGVVNPSDSPPNFMLLLPDQLRYDWINPAGYVKLQTPNMERIVSEGTYFKQAYVPSPLCAPSRACLAAGRRYDRAGVLSNFGNDYPVNQTTFYTLLQQQGYHVMTAGKDDLTKKSSPGTDGSFNAQAMGFSDWSRCSGKVDVDRGGPHEPYGLFLNTKNFTSNETLYDVHHSCMRGCIQDYPNLNKAYACPNYCPLPQETYEDNWVSQEGIKLLNRKPKNKPWFLQVNFPGPHPPFSITKSMNQTVPDEEMPLAYNNPDLDSAMQQIVRKDYLAEIQNLDVMMGLYLNYLNLSGELKNTIVCILSDHGEMLGDLEMWGKTLPYQGSIGVPFACMGPSITKQVVDFPVATLDLAGTLLDYAGVKIPNSMDTKSLRSILSGKVEPNRKFVNSGLGSWRAVVQVDGITTWKLVCCQGKCPNGEKDTEEIDWDFLQSNKFVLELYNLTSDIGEGHDLSKDSSFTDVMKSMKELLPKEFGCKINLEESLGQRVLE